MGFIFLLGIVEAIKEKILFFYEHPEERDRMGNNALNQARGSLSWHNYGNKMIAAYQSAKSLTS
jgi:glycosyltransferase involved in cell wall biosynthesis